MIRRSYPQMCYVWVAVLVMLLATACAAPPAVSELTRSIATPAAPAIDAAECQADLNEQLYYDTSASTTMLSSDFMLRWSHEDPISVDYYEIWRATGEGYWTPETCVSCALIMTSTGMSETLTSSPPDFAVYRNPASGLDVYLVRAVNGGGTADSNMIGVITFSLMQYTKDFKDGF